jgi:hypothetical protein
MEAKTGTKMFVSNISETRALQDKNIRYYVCRAPNGGYFCLSGNLQNEASFLEPVASTEVKITYWEYAVPCPEEPVKEMTLKEIQEKLGYKIKIVG